MKVLEEYEKSPTNYDEIGHKIASVDENGNHEDDYEATSNDSQGKSNDAPPIGDRKKLQRMQKDAKFRTLFDENKHLFDLNCDHCSNVFESFNECRAHYLNAHNISKGYIKCCGLKLHFPCHVEAHLDRHLRPNKHKYETFSLPFFYISTSTNNFL